MKPIKSIILLLAFCAIYITGLAQSSYLPNGNAPDGKTSPTVAQSAFVTPPSSYNSNGNTPPTNYNYTRTWNLTQPVTNEALLGLNSQASATIQTAYLNGWGNVLQTTQRCTNSNHDLVTPVDNRASTTSMQYLPYAVSTDGVGPAHFQLQPFIDQQGYYSNLYPDEGTTAYNRSTTSGYDIQSYSAGKSLTGSNKGSWQSTQAYSGTDIRAWEVYEDYYNTIYQTNTTYAANTLTQKITNNSEGVYVTEFYDKNNQLVCKQAHVGHNAGSDEFLWTYYVYDDLGKLRCIIPPKAVEAMQHTGYFLSQDILSGFCYTYAYDEYGQLYKTTTPGKANPEYTIYDRKHRPVLRQTSAMNDGSGSTRWLFTVYDSRNRVVMTGITDPSSNSYHDWQAIADGSAAAYGTSVGNFIQNDFDPSGYQTLQNYTLTDGTIYEINYYDQYDLHPDITGRSFVGYWPDYLTTTGAILPEQSSNVNGLLTGKRTFIENSPYARSWINTVYFYDRFGRVIETQTQNPFADNTLGFWDNNAVQYDFAGRTILAINDHQAWSTADKSGTKVLTRFAYDATTNKLSTVSQKTDGNAAWVDISKDAYDELGRLSSHTMGGVEIQKSSYNIRGQLTGVNKDYVYDPNCVDNGRMNFGMTLSYDYGFMRPRTDGNIAGFIWRGAGSGSYANAYGYSYDDGGRMISADFNQRTPSGVSPDWTNQFVDYSANNISYDANGNLLSLNQKGTPDYFAGPTDIDVLSYQYQPNSNVLAAVADGIGIDYGLGDFQDHFAGSATIGSTPDYDYDANGNLKVDRNKGINNISYNYFDLPTSVTTNTGTIENVYACDGTLLQKRINDYNSGHTDEYRYWGNFVYRNDSLLYALNQEGRARWLPDSSIFKYDFFVKDHLGNVRSTVTLDNGSALSYLNSNEISMAVFEARFFDGIAPVRDDNPLTNDPNDLKCSLLNGSDPQRRIGPSFLTRVMSGDVFEVTCNSFYEEGSGNDNVSADAESMMQSLISTLSGGGGGGFSTGEGVDPSGIVPGLFNPENYLNVYDALKEQNTNPALPRAYLNYIVFDENMQIVPEESGAIQIGAGANGWQSLGTNSAIKIGRNGYLSVYVSNEQYRDVFFDNLYIKYTRGRLLQEQNYYPHGLVINMGSNTPLANKYMYQDKLYQDELGLDLYDFHARQYDPQIGRFWGIDPASQFPSGYTGMANDPANNIDPTGMLANGATNNFVPAEMLGEGGGDGISTSDMVQEALENMDKIEENNAALDDAKAKAQQSSQGKSLAVMFSGLAAFGSSELSQYTIGISLSVSGVNVASTVGTAAMTLGLVALPTNIGETPHSEMPDLNVPIGAIGANYQNFTKLRSDYGTIARFFSGIVEFLGKKNAPDAQVYRLYAETAGEYPVVERGKSGAVGKVHLEVGDTWKYGMTTKENVYGSGTNSRYTPNSKPEKYPVGISQETIYNGNNYQAKFVEHMMIMNYFFLFGKLPPGNKVPW